MRRTLKNIWRLGVKELYSVRYDGFLLFLIVYSFSYAIYSPAKNAPSGVQDASIAIVDEDRSALSRRISAAFLPPYFKPPVALALGEVDHEMDAGRYTFVVDLPRALEADVRRGRTPTIQLLADATAMTQAGTGMGYIQQIITQEVNASVGSSTAGPTPIRLVTRVKFNPNLDATPFSAVVQLANSITLLALFLSGAAIIREREHGTIEHLLVMPLRPLEIMLAKIWANGVVVLGGTGLAVQIIVRGVLGLTIAGSFVLFMAAVALYVFALSALGIFLGTVGRSMPQFSLLAFPVYIVMNLLSGGRSPLESMPVLLQRLMQLSPSTHFMRIAQAVLYRGADLTVVWREFAALSVIGAAFFVGSLWRFRRTLVG